VLEAGHAPTDLAAGDFNGDGRLDLLAAVPGNLGQNPGGLSLFLGNGDGTFQPAAKVPAGNIPSSLAVADFNRDKKTDVAVSNRQLVTGGTMDSIRLLTGDGKGGFGTPVTVATVPLNDEVTSLFTADFNGDGNPDLAYLIVSTDDTLADTVRQRGRHISSAEGRYYGPGQLFDKRGLNWRLQQRWHSRPCN
jgi:hypothetical protein